MPQSHAVVHLGENGPFFNFVEDNYEDLAPSKPKAKPMDEVCPPLWLNWKNRLMLRLLMKLDPFP